MQIFINLHIFISKKLIYDIKGDGINVESLLPGNYMLQLISKENVRSFKFIRKQNKNRLIF
ncbi:hypothetical protein IX38_13865 [Chryseobacterium luteum]|uniref:Secretion system C-terminal sorting domain-containing protein n=1 Tax=Chryseobacterium luteum TaxID=421531 RepID=A0A085ZCZ2_9FLAO|nr:hypothetical protein IX38_13865 [Chryseobacterium luteum]